MNSDRLTSLLNYLKEDPNDAFTKYAIAMEYMNENPRKSIKWLEDLLDNHPDYLPSYYQAGKLYQALEASNKAQIILEKGIILASSQANHHTLRELRNALNELLFDDD